MWLYYMHLRCMNRMDRVARMRLISRALAPTTTGPEPSEHRSPLKTQGESQSLAHRPVVGAALRIVLALAVAAALLPLAAGSSAAQTSGDRESERLWGPDRYATSLAVARRFVQEAGGQVNAAVVVSGVSWHDAVIAAGLAGHLDAPVLLSRRNGLTPEASRLLTAAGVSEIVVVGSTEAVPEEAFESLKQLGSVSRVTAATPSAASVAVAERIGIPGVMPGSGTTVIVAGDEVFVDAMVAGGFSARGRHPVLLTSPDWLDASVKSFVANRGVQHVVIMGGIDAVSAAVEDDLEGLGVNVTRLGGRDRFGTARAVAEFLEGKYSSTSTGGCFDRSTAGLATARVPFDAFSAGPLLGKLCAPLLLSGVQRGDAATIEWLADRTQKLVVFGGAAAVSESALSAALEAARPEPEQPALDIAAIEGIFADAAERRAAAVADLTAKINAGTYGVDTGNVLRGPGGFRVDLDDCPSDWSDTEGITSSQIRIGHTTVQSGWLAAFNNVSRGVASYFEWINENDPIMVDGAPRELMLVVKDDGYDYTQTRTLVNELIQSDDVLSILTLGAPTTREVYDTINEKCVPHPFVMNAESAWGDPVNHPWTTGLEMSYSTESVLWGTWIEKNLTDRLPVKVAGLVMDNNFGNGYAQAFQRWADRHPEVVSSFTAVRHNPAADLLTSEMKAVADAQPDVVILMTAGRPCSVAIREAGRNGLTDDINAKGGALFVPSVCRNYELYVKPAGEHADGWWSVNGGMKTIDDPRIAEEPFISFVNSRLKADGLDPATSSTVSTSLERLYGYGYFHGYPYVEALRIAAALPGGLTRTNFMLAVRSIDIYHPMILDGIGLRLDGTADAFAVEGTSFERFDIESKSWRAVGKVIDVDGETPNCNYEEDDLGNGRCR